MSNNIKKAVHPGFYLKEYLLELQKKYPKKLIVNNESEDDFNA